MELIHSNDLMWGLVHGDFHYGQMMYQDVDGTLLIEDWEFTGMLATPTVDLATLFIGSTDPKTRLADETWMIPMYYQYINTLSKVHASGYTEERLWAEYKTYGFSHAVARNLFFMSVGFADQFHFDQLDQFV